MSERQTGYSKPAISNMAPQENIVLADMLNLQLGQIQADVQDQLVNNDFEGDFFKKGDTVQIVAIDPNSVKIVVDDKTSMRPALDGLRFKSATMTIDKSMKYGFKIYDLDRIEDSYNHESALTALAARKMREAHNLETLELILKNADIRRYGSLTNPIDLTGGGNDDPGETLFALVNTMKSYLKANGALDSNAEYTYGSNKTVPLRANASLFVAPEIYTTLLNSQYKRYDDVSEGVIRAGKYEKFAGFILNEVYELSSESNIHVNVDGTNFVAGKKVGFIIVGTKNTVTRAGKVLPPEKLRDLAEFADIYNGWEIYGQMVAVPECCCIAVVSLPIDSRFTPDEHFSGDNTTLMTQFANEDPRRTNTAATDAAGNIQPAYGSYGYGLANGEEGTGYPLNEGDAASTTHIHTFDVSGDAQTGVETSAPTEPDTP